MSKPKMLLCFLFLVFLLVFPSVFAEESITITTYYPSPYGSYNELYVASKLGIGTTDPGSYKTVIQSATSLGTGLLKLHVNSGSTGDVNGIDFGHYSNPAVVAPIRAYIRDEVLTDWSMKLHFGTAPGTLLTAASTRMTIDGSGNVGIGTTGPSKKLSIGSNLHSAGDGILVDGVIGLAWGTNVPTPSAGNAYIWLDSADGALKVKFSNGVVRTLATP